MRLPLLIAIAIVCAPAAAHAQFRLPAKLSDLENTARRDSNDAAAHYNLALAYWNAKRWEDVERELRLAVTIEPQFAEGWLALSRLPDGKRLKLWEDIASRRLSDQDQPQVEQAYRYYQRAFIINPLVDLRIEAAASATDTLLDQRLARILAARAAEVRWGPDAREEFILRNDRTVRIAVEQFSRLRELLAAPNTKQ